MPKHFGHRLRTLAVAQQSALSQSFKSVGPGPNLQQRLARLTVLPRLVHDREDSRKTTCQNLFNVHDASLRFGIPEKKSRHARAVFTQANAETLIKQALFVGIPKA